MPSHYKAFLVVLTITVLTFWLARPVFRKFMADEDFVRRRNLWLILTTCAFLIPSFWVYMAVAGVLIWRAGKRDSNPAALYLFLLMVVPPFQQPIPGFGLVNMLFPLDHFRLLGFALILPVAVQLRRAAKQQFSQSNSPTWGAADILIVVYGCLQVVLYAPFVPATGTLRALLMLFVDLLLPYYVLSRFCCTKPLIIEAIAALALSAIVLAPLAIFESVRGWLLYSGIGDNWRLGSDVFGYLLRSDILRAQVTSGQSIVLGNFYAVVLGLWLFLQSELIGLRRWLGTAAVIGGLLAAFSRGPWVGAVICLFTFYAVGPNAKKQTLKLIGISAVVTAVALASPIGASIIDHLPYVGTVDEGNVTYRQQVNDRSWLIIQQNPFFGSPYFINYMEDLRTGQGIIDLLNAYLSIGMAYGLVTLAVFVLLLLVVTVRCLRAIGRVADFDPEMSRLGAALFAAMMGALVIIYTVNNYLSVPYIYIAVAALMVSYAKLAAVSIVRVGPEGDSLAAGRHERGPKFGT